MKKQILVLAAVVVVLPFLAFADDSSVGLLTMPGSGADNSSMAATSTGSSGLGGLMMPGYSGNDGDHLNIGLYASGPRLIQLEGSATVYWVSPNNLKLGMSNAKVFLSYRNKWSDVESVGQDEFDYYQNAKYIWLNGGGGIYKINGTVKQLIGIDAWAQAGVDAGQIISVNRTEFNSYSNGAKITTWDEVTQ